MSAHVGPEQTATKSLSIACAYVAAQQLAKVIQAILVYRKILSGLLVN